MPHKPDHALLENTQNQLLGAVQAIGIGDMPGYGLRADMKNRRPHQSPKLL